MSVWDEPIPPGITHSFFSPDHRVKALVRRRDHFGGLNSVSFMRYRGCGQFHMPERQPGQWVVLRPHEPMNFETLDAAMEKARSLLEQVGNGTSDELFEITPYQPKRPERVQEVSHPSGRIMALVLRHDEARYEVRCFQHEMLGVWPKTQTEEWDWVRTQWDTATFASTLPEAEQAARAQMDQIISTGEKTMLQDRFPWVGENPPASRSQSKT